MSANSRLPQDITSILKLTESDLQVCAPEQEITIKRSKQLALHHTEK